MHHIPCGRCCGKVCNLVPVNQAWNDLTCSGTETNIWDKMLMHRKKTTKTIAYDSARHGVFCYCLSLMSIDCCVRETSEANSQAHLWKIDRFPEEEVVWLTSSTLSTNTNILNNHPDSSWIWASAPDQWVDETNHRKVSLKPAGTWAPGVGVESSQPWTSASTRKTNCCVTKELIHGCAAELNHNTQMPYDPAKN